jgi:exodeoxyribonuclease V alpha subunit
MEVLSGSVERVTYYNAENGYSVIRLRPERLSARGVNREGLITAVGNLPELSAGEYLRLQGQWVNHPTHGLQFQIEICEQTLPATVAGIRRYLGSGLIKGIGPRLAERIVARFGTDTLNVIEEQPERLREVADIGPKRSRMIARAWEEQKQVKEIMLFLHSYGVSTNLAIKIYKQYGDQALPIVQSDPYRLARDIFGVGFRTADRIAQALGLPADHPSRIEAGVVYVLNELSDEGHVFAPRTLLIEKGSSLLGQLPGGLPGEMPGKMPGEMPGGLILPAVERLEQDGRVRQDMVPLEASATTSEEGKTLTARESEAGYYQPAVYLTALYASEVGAAERLAALTQAFPSRLSDLPPAFMSIDPSLSAEQQAAIRAALSHPVSVLTGGPGTGKTTALKALIAALESANKSYALASPTGRAAKRLAEATGRSASTIHPCWAFHPRRASNSTRSIPC